MKLFIIVFMEIALCDVLNIEKSTVVTPNIHERVASLKLQIAQEIKGNLGKSQSITPLIDKDTFSDDYEYIDIDNKPITPIMNFDERKKRNKFKLKEIMTKTTSKDIYTSKARLRSNRITKKIKKSYLRKPSDIFYRRAMTEEEMNTPLLWAHCQCLITPFLEGYKCNMSKVKIIKVTDNIVGRLIQLLTVNTTNYTKEEVYSVLYQISNLNLKFFQWDLTSLQYLFMALSPDTEKNTFRSLKAGVKRLFASWHLDIGNLTNLLKQARIFRPPCIISKYDFGGSTVSSKNAFTGKIAKHRKKCNANDKSCVKYNKRAQ